MKLFVKREMRKFRYINHNNTRFLMDENSGGFNDISTLYLNSSLDYLKESTQLSEDSMELNLWNQWEQNRFTPASDKTVRIDSEVLKSFVGRPITVSYDVSFMGVDNSDITSTFSLTSGGYFKTKNGSTLVSDNSELDLLLETVNIKSDIFIPEEDNLNLEFELFIPDSTSDFTGIKINNITVQDVDYVEIKVSNPKDIVITKSIKDVKNIDKVTGGYADRIIVSEYNVKPALGDFLSAFDSEAIVKDGLIKAVLTLDNGDAYYYGELILKDIESVNNSKDYIFLFLDGAIAMLNNLGTKYMRIKDYNGLYIDGSDTNVYDGLTISSEQAEIDRKKYVFGLNLKEGGIGEDTRNSVNIGSYSEGLSKFESGIGGGSTINMNTNSNFGFVTAGAGITNLATPLFRVKELFIAIHKRYGIEVSGEILDNPMFYNMIINSSEVRDETHNSSASTEKYLNTVDWNFWSGDETKIYCIIKDLGGGSKDYKAIRQHTVGHRAETPFTTKMETTFGDVGDENANLIHDSSWDNTTDNILSSEMNIPSELLNATYNTTNNKVNSFARFKDGVAVNGELDVKLSLRIDDLLDSTNKDNQFVHKGTVRLVVYDVIGRNTTTPIDANTELDVLDTPYSFYHEEQILVDHILTFDEDDVSTYQISRDIKVKDFNLGANEWHGVRAFLMTVDGEKVELGYKTVAGYELKFESYINCTLKYNEKALLSDSIVDTDNLRIGVSEKNLMKFVIQKFNLIPNRIDDTHIEYVTHDEFYTNNTTLHDWSDKVNRFDKVIEEPFLNNLPNNYEFSDKLAFEDDDEETEYGHLKFGYCSAKNNTNSVKSNIMVSRIYGLSDSPYGGYRFNYGINKLVSNADEDNSVAISESVRLFSWTPANALWEVANNNTTADSVNYVTLSTTDGYIRHGSAILFSKDGWDFDTKIIHFKNNDILNKPNIGYLSKLNIRARLTDTIGDYTETGDPPSTEVTALSPLNYVAGSCGYSSHLSQMHFLNSITYGTEVANQTTSLFNTFYRNKLENLISTEGNTLEAKILLNSNELIASNLGDKIVIDGKVYIIDNVKSKFDNDLCKIKLTSYRFNDNGYTVYDSRLEGNFRFPFIIYGEHIYPASTYETIHTAGLGWNKFSSTYDTGTLGIYTGVHTVGAEYVLVLGFASVDTPITFKVRGSRSDVVGATEVYDNEITVTTSIDESNPTMAVLPYTREASALINQYPFDKSMDFLSFTDISRSGLFRIVYAKLIKVKGA